MTRPTSTALLVGLTLFCAYSLFYSGTVHAFDQEEGMLLVADSLVRQGAFDVDQHLNISDATIALPAERIAPDGHNYLKFGLPTSLAAAPLYALGLALPGVGAVQAAFALNALLTAATGALLTAIVHRLGYRLPTAAAVGLVFGLATMAAVYARFFGSEPLVGFALTLALWALVRYRTRGHWLDAAWLGWALGLAVAARPATVVVVPFFAIAFLRHWVSEIGYWRLKISDLQYPISSLLPGLLWLLLILAYNFVRFGAPLATGYGANETFSTPLLTGLYGLLGSPGKSLFLYSPVLVLAAGGALLRGRGRTPGRLALFLLTVSFVYLGLYAMWNGWWGGVYWGPRHAAPVIPLLAVLLAPMLAAARTHRLARAVVIAFVAISLAPQLLGGLMDFEPYEVQINQWAPNAAFAMIYWPALSPLLAHLRAFQIDDVTWALPTVDWRFPILVLIAAGYCLWATLSAARGKARRPAMLVISALVSAGLLWGVLLARAYARAPYGPIAGPRAALHAMETQTQARDVLLSRTGERSLVIMNSMRARLPWYTFDARPELPQDEVEAHLARVLADARRVWLLTPEPRDLSNPTSLFLEAWLSARAFPISDEVYGPSARLILYEFPAAGQPALPSGVQFGEAIQLDSLWFESAAGHLKVELDWVAVSVPDTNYSVSVQLLAADGTLAAQRDHWPVNGLNPTATWQPGDVIADRYALATRGLAAGEYTLWLAVYDPATLERLPVAGGDALFLGNVRLDAGR